MSGLEDDNNHKMVCILKGDVKSKKPSLDMKSWEMRENDVNCFHENFVTHITLVLSCLFLVSKRF